MYIKIKNISLEKILKRYGVNRLEELEDNALLKLCRELGLQENWIMSKEENINLRRREGLDRVKVIDTIMDSNTFNDYMGTVYWEPEHDTLDGKYNIRASLRGHDRGDQTFKTMENVRMGFSKLRPGEERELEISSNWLEEYFLLAPSTTYGDKNEDPKILVFNKDGKVLNIGYVDDAEKKKEEEIQSILETTEKIELSEFTPIVSIEKGDSSPVTGNQVVITREATAGVNFEIMNINILRAIAKGYKINTGNKSKAVIIDMIKERLILDNKVN